MGFLDRVFRRRARDLSSVDGPTRVELECRVASPDVLVSPVTGTEAALIRWSLLRQSTAHGGRGGGVATSFRTLEQGLYGDAEAVLLAFDGQAIAVPLARAALVLIEDEADGQLLDTVPPTLAAALGRIDPRVTVAYREAFLSQGDGVVLTATLERLRTDEPPGYRASAATGRPHLRALPDERIVLRERGAG